MAETTELITLLRQQMVQQAQYMEQQSQQHRVEMEQQAKYMEQQVERQEQQIERQSQQHREEMQNLLKLLDVQKYGTGEDDSSTHNPQLSTAAIPPFAAFDSVICCIWFDVRTVAWLLVKSLHICGGQCCTWATRGTSFPHQSNCCCIQTTG